MPWWRNLGRWLLLTHRAPTERHWELDALRGLAIVLMVSYHLVFDLAFYGYYGAPVTQGFWRLYGRTSATLFLLLVGISLTIGYNRGALRTGRPPRVGATPREPAPGPIRTPTRCGRGAPRR